MKQKNISAAYQAVTRLYKIQGLPFKISMDLFLLKKKLDPYIELEAEKERVLFDASDESGVMSADVKREITKILEAEVSWEEDPIHFSLPTALIEKMGITGEVLDKLDGFVTIEEIVEG